jgi:predicted nucleic acid-binding protein
VALVLDTGVLYAALDAEDPDHSACADLIDRADEQLIIPVAVLVELDYWIRKMASADVWLAFCEDVASGSYAVYPLDPELLRTSAQIESRYADLGLGLVDATVFATCEAIGERKVATLDRRHFSVLRTTEGKALEILPSAAV